MVKASPFMRSLLYAIEELLENNGKDINIEAEATNEAATVNVWAEIAGQKVNRRFSAPIVNSESMAEMKVKCGKFSEELPNIIIADSSIGCQEKECVTNDGTKFNFVRCLDFEYFENAIEDNHIIAAVMNVDSVSDKDALKDMISKHSEIIWICTGDKCKEYDRIEGLNDGACLFLARPFSLEMVAAQVKAIVRLRRREGHKGTEQSQSTANNLCKKNKFSGEVYNLILRRLSDPSLSIDALSREMGVSRATIFNKIRSQTGLTPNVLIRKIRLEKAAELLRKPNVRVSEIYDQTGFISGSYFSKLFKEEFGITPKEFCDKGKDN